VTDRRHGPWVALGLSIVLGVLLWVIAVVTVTCAVAGCLD
jgi:hypothetical protein